MEEKAALRKLYIDKRKALTRDDVDSLSTSIVEQFLTMPLSLVRYLHIFYPIAARHEFNTLLLAEKLRLHHPSVKLVLPKSNLQHNTLTHSLWTDSTPLSVNSWGITEPIAGQEIAPRDIDMVIIPLLAFDKRGNRLGYGKGFYDRFLAECRPDVEKVGVSFFEPEAIIASGPHDIPLNHCVTPATIWHF